MISRLIRESFHALLLTALLVAAGTTIGAFWMQDLRRDVFPDLSAPVFNVITQNPAMGAEELETAIAIPIEVALAGLPDVRRVRSNSQLGVAQVTIEFDPSADYYRARQFVAERVAQVSGQLPPGTDPPLISSLTGRLNEIFEFTLEADPGAADLMTLRDLAEFEVNNRLLAVPGVAAVERLGGYLRQFQIQLDPERMSARLVSLDEVMHAVEESNLNASGGIVAQGSIEWTVRALGRAQTVDDLRRTVVITKGDVPVLLGDVADVREAAAGKTRPGASPEGRGGQRADPGGDTRADRSGIDPAAVSQGNGRRCRAAAEGEAVVCAGSRSLPSPSGSRGDCDSGHLHPDRGARPAHRQRLHAAAGRRRVPAANRFPPKRRSTKSID